LKTDAHAFQAHFVHALMTVRKRLIESTSREVLVEKRAPGFVMFHWQVLLKVAFFRHGVYPPFKFRMGF
jgi:hypothetical protein